MDHLCYLCLVFAMLSRRFIAVICRERADLLAFVSHVYFNFTTFQFGILGQVCSLIISIPDPCCLSFLVTL